jgi:hypothetical protein
VPGRGGRGRGDGLSHGSQGSKGRDAGGIAFSAALSAPQRSLRLVFLSVLGFLALRRSIRDEQRDTDQQADEQHEQWEELEEQHDRDAVVAPRSTMPRTMSIVDFAHTRDAINWKKTGIPPIGKIVRVAGPGRNGAKPFRETASGCAAVQTGGIPVQDRFGRRPVERVEHQLQIRG